MPEFTEKSRRNVRRGDVVEFRVRGRDPIRYTVNSTHLSCSGANDRVFAMLGLDKEKFARAAYGYPPRGGEWPEYRGEDYAAATRIIRALFKAIGRGTGRLMSSSAYCRKHKLPVRFAKIIDYFRVRNFGCQTEAAQGLMQAYFGCPDRIPDIIRCTRADGRRRR